MTTARALKAPQWPQRTSDAGIGCYVHLPFCHRICPYCDFSVVVYDERRSVRYLSALLHEIGRMPAPATLQTLYFGGGTPSLLPVSHIDRLAAALRSRPAEEAERSFRDHPGAIEFTMEANPARDASDLSAWLQARVNRLSIGVQSFDDRELHALGRDHTAEQALKFYEAARAVGFDNISLDLIAGSPGQTIESFKRSVTTAVACGADHVSVYGLAIEDNTPYAAWHGRDPRAFPDDDAVAAALEIADDILTDAGFIHYELSNFARPGFECAHNIGYWRQRDCIAYGLSASGYRAGLRYRNLRSFDAYCNAVEREQEPREEEERLGFAARVGEAAMLALRLREGIEYADFRRRFAIDPERAFARAVKKCLAADLLEVDGESVRLSKRGRLLANSVCAEFLAPDLSS
ncbi:MAG: coproporphyrinogen III oxidase [Candidatus Eremiobacter antarcticus]|nr:radical SAM family heme chaperone HemW [Candidatus Eremiobacteraeota bacterium]MBC5808655.1 radical SAM family heme chaperone HemW [Candidatus Eremiobacteraeota bacterium]PZR62144.1 MAG: coproporphyrinogen III oxidase [Candidatus Eremiobacter sp. RRmetagenome_bin22]